MSKEKRRLFTASVSVAAVLFLCLSLNSCGKQDQQRGQQIKELAVITLSGADVELSSSYPAVIKGKQDIEIRPQVSGFITRLAVDEGSVVKKGQTLFIIDPVQYEEAANAARAWYKWPKPMLQPPSLLHRISANWLRTTLSVLTNCRWQRIRCCPAKLY